MRRGGGMNTKAIASEIRRWAKVVKDANIKAQ